MARGIILLLLLFIVQISRAQHTIQGHIKDVGKSTIGFSTVALMKDSVVAKSVIADSLGYYKLEDISSGEYKIRVSYIGQRQTGNIFKVGRDTVIDIIFTGYRELAEVQVTSKKPLIERKIDRLVFNVANSAALQGLDLMDALANTPMLRASEDGISIVGKSGVGVLVDDRPLNLSGKELISYLKSLRADNIDRIEVLTTPPARYDAQGNSGLINIVLKKNPNDGFSGNVSTSYIQRTWGSISGNGALNYKVKNLTLSGRLSGYDNAYRATEIYNIDGSEKSNYKYDRRKDFNDGFNANLSLDYRISESASFGFMYNYMRGHTNMDIVSRNSFLSGTTLDSTLITDAKHRISFNNHVGNVYYDLKLNKKGSTLSFLGNYLSNSNLNPVNFFTQNDDDNSNYAVRNQSDVTYRILSGQGDLVLPFQENLKVETGLKFTNIKNESDVRYLDLIDADYVLDPSKSNMFNYNENNYAAYISASKDFGKAFSVKGGLRYEHTNVDGYSPSSGETIGFSYGRFFPTVYVTYRANDANVLSLNYSRRINRPGFGQLNPFRWYSNPYNYHSGNAQLQPSFSNNFELVYVLKNAVTITLYHQRTNDSYSRVSRLEGTTAVSTWLNYLTERSEGLSAYYSFNRFNWWQSTIFADVFHTKSKSVLPEFIGQSGTSFYYQVNNTFFLNKAKNLSFSMDYWHNLPSRTGNTIWSNRANMSLGFNSWFFDKTLQLSVSGSDIFRQTYSKGRLIASDNVQYFQNYYDGQRLTVSVSYTFGNKRVGGVKKDTKFDDRGRAN